MSSIARWPWSHIKRRHESWLLKGLLGKMAFENLIAYTFPISFYLCKAISLEPCYSKCGLKESANTESLKRLLARQNLWPHQQPTKSEPQGDSWEALCLCPNADFLISLASNSRHIL